LQLLGTGQPMFVKTPLGGAAGALDKVMQPVDHDPFEPGLLEPGNINLHNRPKVRNADGSISTVKSMSINIDDKEVLIPTISDDGETLSKKEAVELYLATGKHLGIFDTPKSATRYAKKLSGAQAKEYVPKKLKSVDHDPFAPMQPNLIAVDHDPFAMGMQ
jgi:hypothetical protein